MSEHLRQRYNAIASAAAPTDFWGQVKRTIHGKPVGEEQIALIVSAVSDGLQLKTGDVLLDLGCGNGALTDLIFSQCSGGLGVDISDALIDIAKANFERLPQRAFLRGDLVEFAARPHGERPFTKALCYGTFAHLDDAAASAVLSGMRANMPGIERFFIGNVPDRERMNAFYTADSYVQGIELDPCSAVGLWRTKAGVAALGDAAGWNVEFHQMPAHFYGAHYRFDAILTARPHDA